MPPTTITTTPTTMPTGTEPPNLDEQVDSQSWKAVPTGTRMALITAWPISQIPIAVTRAPAIARTSRYGRAVGLTPPPRTPPGPPTPGIGPYPPPGGASKAVVPPWPGPNPALKPPPWLYGPKLPPGP